VDEAVGVADSSRGNSRYRGLVMLTVAAGTLGLFLRYQSNRMRDNELAQKNSQRPNFYVSVERSGGGI